MNGLLGRKIGMTQVYGEDGRHVPVTVLRVGPCVAVQLKTQTENGYDAVQLGFEEQKESRITKPELGHFKKAGASPKRILREFRLDAGDGIKVGDVVTADVLKGTAFVDVTGVTKGRGFQGVIKRHRMSGGPGAHGSGTHRRVGSVGCRAIPGNIHKRKRMPGHMGHVRVTVQNLRVVRVVPEDHLVLVRGAVAGPTGGLVTVMKARKKAAVKA